MTLKLGPYALHLLSRKKIIAGCESRGDAGSPYLTRWTLVELVRPKRSPGDDGSILALYLHRFHRSDHDDMHDHPWGFVSLILWRGYLEETSLGNREIGFHGRVRRRVWPGMLLFRPASHVHRVELVDGRESWSLVARGAYVRPWGFFTREGWQGFRKYFSERGC